MGNTCNKKVDRKGSENELKYSPEKNKDQKIEPTEPRIPRKPLKIFNATELNLDENEVFQYMTKRKALVPEMKSFNENEWKSDSINPKLLEALGFSLFDQNEYENIMSLYELITGEENFACHKYTAEVLLIKTLKLLPPEQKSKKEFLDYYIYSLVMEKFIMEHIAKENSRYIGSLRGLKYSVKHEKDVKAMYLLSSVGLCSVAQLYVERKKLKESQQPFDLKEALIVIRSMVKALKILQKHKIYHSDIKLDNVFINLKQKSYQLSGFSVAWVLPNECEKIEAREYAVAGTPENFSPEKKFHWDASIQRRTLLDHENKIFNPFKEDVYSLGLCFSKMIGGEANANGKYKDLLQKMLSNDWEVRPDANELDKFIEASFDPKIFAAEINSLDVEIANKLTETVDFRDRFIGMSQQNLPKAIRLEFLENNLGRLVAKPIQERRPEEEESVAWIQYHKAWVMSESNDFERALESLEEAITLWNRIHVGALDGYLAASYGLKGHILAKMGLYENARRVFEQQLALERKLHQTDEWPDIAATLSCIAAMTSRLGDNKKALESYQRVYEIQTNLFSTEDNEEVADTITSMAYELGKLGEAKRSIDEHKKAVELRKKLYGSDEHLKIADNLESIANKLEDKSSALKEHQNVLRIRRKVLQDEESLEIATSFRNIALALASLGNKSEAISNMEKAYEIRKKIYKTNDHPCVERTKYLLDKMKYEN